LLLNSNPRLTSSNDSNPAKMTPEEHLESVLSPEVLKKSRTRRLELESKSTQTRAVRMSAAFAKIDFRTESSSIIDEEDNECVCDSGGMISDKVMGFSCLGSDAICGPRGQTPNLKSVLS